MVSRTIAAGAALALSLAPYGSALGSPLSMSMDRAPLAQGQPAPICANRVATSPTCDAIGTMSPAGVFTPVIPPKSVPANALPSFSGATASSLGDYPQSISAYPSVAAALAAGKPLIAPPSFTTPIVPIPDNVVVEYHGYMSNVAYYDETGNPGAFAYRTLQVYMGNGMRANGTQDLLHLQVISEGAAANPAVNAGNNSDEALNVSVIKKNYASYSATNGQLNGISINTRNGGANIKQNGDVPHENDSNGIAINMAGLVGATYQAMIEGSAFSFGDASKNYAQFNSIGMQIGVVDSIRDNYFGALFIAKAGVNSAGLLVQAEGSATFTDLLRGFPNCNGTTPRLVYDVAFQTGATTWNPCGGGGLTLAPNATGMQWQNASGAVLQAIDQAGSVTFNNAAAGQAVQFKIQDAGTTKFLFGKDTNGNFSLLDGNNSFLSAISLKPDGSLSLGENTAGPPLQIAKNGAVLVTAAISLNAVYVNGGTPGAACSGAPTSSFSSSNGIVTHC